MFYIGKISICLPDTAQLCYVPDGQSPDYSFQSQLMVPYQVVNADSSPETSPIRPLPRSASTANLQSASKLILSSKLVYSKRLDLPHGVEVTRATPSAGLNALVFLHHIAATRIQVYFMMLLGTCWKMLEYS